MFVVTTHVISGVVAIVETLGVKHADVETSIVVAIGVYVGVVVQVRGIVWCAVGVLVGFVVVFVVVRRVGWFMFVVDNNGGVGIIVVSSVCRIAGVVCVVIGETGSKDAGNCGTHC